MQFQKAFHSLWNLNTALTHSQCKTSYFLLWSYESDEVEPDRICLCTQFWDNAYTGLPDERRLEGVTPALPDYITGSSAVQSGPP